MNSLEDLNNLSDSLQISYTDSRTPNVTFDRDTASDQFVSILEGQTHTVPVGIEITDIINYDTVAVTYTIDLTDNTGSTATWPTLPAYMNIDDSTADVYVVSGFRSTRDWELAKSPTITMPSSYFGEWTYSPTITYVFEAAAQTVSWDVDVDVTESDALSEASEFIFDISTTQTITGNPTNVDTGTGSPTYTITVTPSNTAAVSTMSSAGSGGGSSFNASTKVLTITGTLAQTNSHLNSISLTATALEVDYTLTYALTASTGETDTKVQNLKADSILFLGTYTAVIYYQEDTVFTIAGAPAITDTDTDGSGTYTYTLTPSSTSAVTTMSSTGSGGTSSFNASTKVLTITGTRAQVNSHLANISVTPGADYVLNFTFSYAVTTPSTDTATKVQSVLNNGVSDEVSNIAVNRSVWTNTTNFPFATTNYLTQQPQYTGYYTRSSTPFLVTNGREGWNSTPGAELNTDVPKYGTACLSFDRGSFDAVEDQVIFYPNGSLTMTDFTFETWYLDAVQTIPGPYDEARGMIIDSHEYLGTTTSPSTDGLAIHLTNNTIEIWINGAGPATYNFLASDRQWHHLAVSRSSSTVRVFIDGSQIGSFSNSSTFTLRNSDGLALGLGRGTLPYPSLGNRVAFGAPFNDFKGYLDDTRISNSGIYTSNFTPAALGRSPYSLFYFAWDGTDTQWPPSSPTSLTGLPNVSTQTTPQITDADVTNPSYTIQFTCPSSYGSFSLDGVTYSNDVSFTGTKDQCNSIFSQIRFTLNNSNNATITYRQRKNGVTQLTQSIGFIGSAGVVS